MSAAPYDSESLLQELLAKYPDLLAGDQIDTERPRRWLLVAREMSIPAEQDGSGRWSLDRLFIDQDAIPTLVEVKRSTDTRIRREVVGQMLDYAANGVAHWPVEEIITQFKLTCGRDGIDADDRLARFLGCDKPADDFWSGVQTNLQAGRIRMVFVADVIPDELRRVVDFLGRQMDPAKIVAVEIKQYRGEGLQTLVPRVVSQSIPPVKRTQRSSGPATISEKEFLDAYIKLLGEAALPSVMEFLSWAESAGLRHEFRRSDVRTEYRPALAWESMDLHPFSLNGKGLLVFLMRQLVQFPPFNSMDNREELRHRLETIPTFAMMDGGMEGFPRIDTTQLENGPANPELRDTLAWMINFMRSS